MLLGLVELFLYLSVLLKRPQFVDIWVANTRNLDTPMAKQKIHNQVHETQSKTHPN